MIVKARFIGSKPKGRYYPGKVYELDFKIIRSRVPFTLDRYDMITISTVKDLEGDPIDYGTFLAFLKDWNVVSG